MRFTAKKAFIIWVEFYLIAVMIDGDSLYLIHHNALQVAQLSLVALIFYHLISKK